jgi:hypothetical protein
MADRQGGKSRPELSAAGRFVFLDQCTAMAGRPTLYSVEITDAICERLMNGESLRGICSQKEMPDRVTVIRWLGLHEEFATKYARARESQSDYMDDLILETANNCTAETALADRVKIGAYQWRASKLAPKKYGDKITQEHTGADGAPLAATIVLTGRPEPSSAPKAVGGVRDDSD